MQFTHELTAKEISPRVQFGEWGDSYLVLTDTGSVIAEFDLDAVQCVAITSDEFLVITDYRFEYYDDGTLVEGSELLQLGATSHQFLFAVDLIDGTVSGCVSLDQTVSDSSDAVTQLTAGVATWQAPTEILRPNVMMIAVVGSAVLCAVILLAVVAIVLIRREKQARCPGYSSSSSPSPKN